MKNTSLILVLVAAMSFSSWTSANAAEQRRERTEQRTPRNQPPGANRMDPESRIKLMAEKLSLTEEQQSKLKAAYKEELKAMQDLRNSPDFSSLSGQEKREKALALRQKTNEKIASFLNEDQKKKFKEFMAEQPRNRGQGQGQGRPRRQQQ